MTDSPDKPMDLDAKLQEEIEASLGDLSFDDMIEMMDGPKRPAGPTAAKGSHGRRQAPDRSTRTGTVVAIHRNDVLVEFGPKAQGVCPLAQFETPPTIGEKLDFIVERFDQNEGVSILSRQGSVQKAEWESLDVGQVVEARCTGVNKGGLEMEVANHRAFMPAGQVDLRHIEELNVFIGEKMPCEVIELDRRQGRIILSRRSALEAERTEQRKKLMEDLEVGAVLPAVITSLQPYGAFADLGGVDGLIHISDLSYAHIKHPSEVVKEGTQVEVKVLKIDDSQDPPKIGLGLKQLKDNPIEGEMNKLEEGGVVTGKVTKIMDFGAFVEIAPGVDGLVHISELAHERVHKVSQIVKQDQIVTCKVLSVDKDRGRISLSLKAMRTSAGGEGEPARDDDPHMRKLRAQLSEKFGELKGGLG